MNPSYAAVYFCEKFEGICVDGSIGTRRYRLSYLPLGYNISVVSIVSHPPTLKYIPPLSFSPLPPSLYPPLSLLHPLFLPPSLSSSLLTPSSLTAQRKIKAESLIEYIHSHIDTEEKDFFSLYFFVNNQKVYKYFL